jgi:hypothetical protein
MLFPLWVFLLFDVVLVGGGVGSMVLVNRSVKKEEKRAEIFGWISYVFCLVLLLVLIYLYAHQN